VITGYSPSSWKTWPTDGERRQRSDDLVVDAAGPEVYTFDTLVRTIQSAVRSRARIVHLPPRLALLLSQVIGVFLGDVVLTREEVDGLMSGLLVSGGPPTGRTHLSEWLREHAHTVGAKYASEVKRHFRD
jgi:NADH dehydrogenase